MLKGKVSKKPKNLKKSKAHVVPKTRKELRKDKRLQKKENKRNFFQKNKNPEQSLKSHVENFSDNEIDDEEIDSDLEDDVVLPPKVAEFQKQQKEKKAKVEVKKPTNTNLVEEQHKRDLEKQVKMEKESRKNRMKQLRRANEEENQNIAKLEKMLKINKSKNKKRLVEKMFASDGLDYALEFCLGDDDDKPKKKKQKVETNEWDEEDVGEEDGNMDDFGGGDDDEELDFDEQGSELEDGSDFGQSGSEDGESDEDDEEKEEEGTKVKEDIYGRPINPDADSAPQPQKYIPPHQRAAMMGNSEDTKQKEKLERLKKNCKGQLNRLSEANMQKIANSIEQFYRQNSRFDMNDTLGQIIKESLILPTLTNDRMVQEHVVLIAYLHATVGSEIGAHFLQMFINELMEHLKDVESTDVENKQLNNILLILSYFYMFKVFQNNLMVEIISKIHEVLCEKTIECLLLIFQSIGFRLRKDDPTSFKSLIFAIQKKIVESSIELQENARLKYMVDILNAVKNNNMTKLPKYDPELGENLRKKLKAMLTNDKYVTTLNITLTDLLKADEVGKWWVVGSAWSGNIKDIHAAENIVDGNSTPVDAFSEHVLKLAKKQKMNTADRKSIFCVLMSAEDFMDAFEKILRLSIKDQRTVVTVIIHCCLSEKKYNPYYSHVALKFSNYDRKYMLALQFALWDRINEIQSFELTKVNKLAQFILHLIKNQGLSITALKIVDFSSLEKDENTFYLLKEIICGVLLCPSAEECYPVFEKLASNTKLKTFKGSIRLFMQHYLFRNEKKLGLDGKKLELLKERVKMIDTMLAYEDL